ncbi:hypothetical protein M9H77_07723 [Catharanthus roseus]|uniref:Uncharacterized protein n=1 Tax=Catharanthus roseus TaxID=4058 RepID=A0ACC0BW12_CATRO|nr:hypothetical protein M9H77_07723 [Catharanthus roseus]
MALVIRKFKRFYKKDFSKRGKNPPFKKGGQSSSLFKARCFEFNSTDHLVADCSKAIEKDKGALEEKLEALKKKKKGKGLIGALDQDTSESDEKGNIYFMAMENEVQSSPSNSFSLIDDNCDDDPSPMLIEMEEEEIEEKQENDQEAQSLPQDVIYPKGHTKDGIIGDVSQGVRTKRPEESDSETEVERIRRETKRKKRQERTEEGQSSMDTTQILDWIIAMQAQLNDRLDDINGNLHIRLDELDEKIVDIHNWVMRLEQGGKESDEDKDD